MNIDEVVAILVTLNQRNLEQAGRVGSKECQKLREAVLSFKSSMRSSIKVDGLYGHSVSMSNKELVSSQPAQRRSQGQFLGRAEVQPGIRSKPQGPTYAPIYVVPHPSSRLAPPRCFSTRTTLIFCPTLHSTLWHEIHLAVNKQNLRLLYCRTRPQFSSS
jgi:hypothetical protein